MDWTRECGVRRPSGGGEAEGRERGERQSERWVGILLFLWAVPKRRSFLAPGHTQPTGTWPMGASQQTKSGTAIGGGIDRDRRRNGTKDRELGGYRRWTAAATGHRRPPVATTGRRTLQEKRAATGIGAEAQGRHWPTCKERAGHPKNKEATCFTACQQAHAVSGRPFVASWASWALSQSRLSKPGHPRRRQGNRFSFVAQACHVCSCNICLAAAPLLHHCAAVSTASTHLISPSQDRLTKLAARVSTRTEKQR